MTRATSAAEAPGWQGARSEHTRRPLRTRSRSLEDESWPAHDCCGGQATYSFDTGQVTSGGVFQANARLGGRQASPVVSASASGEEFSVFWQDDVTVGSGTSSLVAGQIYRADTVPRDIDFTVSTTSPIDTVWLPDLRFRQGFSFSAAASENSYAVVWQSPSGIVLQRVDGGPAPCPASSGCGNAIPLRSTGDSLSKADLVLVPGAVTVTQDGTDVPRTDFSPLFSGEPDFVRHAVSIFVNAYFSNNVFREHAGKMNLYYDMDRGRRTAVSDGVPSQQHWSLGGELSCDYHFAFDPVADSLADVRGLVLKDASPVFNLFRVADAGCAERWLPDHPQGSFVVNRASDHPAVLHESGHAFFLLREEYHCSADEFDGSGRLIPARTPKVAFSNVYSSASLCSTPEAWCPAGSTNNCVPQSSVNPSGCRAVDSCQGLLWKADPDDCPMSNSPTARDFGADCRRRAGLVVDQKGWK